MWVLQICDDDKDFFVGPFSTYTETLEYAKSNGIRGFFVRFVDPPK